MGAMATRAVSIARVWSWAAQALFGDLRVRYGIKIGLAGVLALFGTQLLRLPNDNWAILTVLVMMSAQFVGSIAFKGIMRVTGTIAGALVGVWLVSFASCHYHALALLRAGRVPRSRPNRTKDGRPALFGTRTRVPGGGGYSPPTSKTFIMLSGSNC